MVTGLPPPSSCAGSPLPTGEPLIEVTASPPAGSLPPATVDWSARIFEIVSLGVRTVLWMLPSVARYSTFIGRPWLDVVALWRSVVTSARLSCRIVELLMGRIVSADLSPAPPEGRLGVRSNG